MCRIVGVKHASAISTAVPFPCVDAPWQPPPPAAENAGSARTSSSPKAAETDRRRIMVSPFFRWRILYTSRQGSVPSPGSRSPPLPDGLGQRDGLRLRQGGFQAEGGAVLLPEQYVARHRKPLLTRGSDER